MPIPFEDQIDAIIAAIKAMPQSAWPSAVTLALFVVTEDVEELGELTRQIQVRATRLAKSASADRTSLQQLHQLAAD